MPIISYVRLDSFLVFSPEARVLASRGSAVIMPLPWVDIRGIQSRNNPKYSGVVHGISCHERAHGVLTQRRSPGIDRSGERRCQIGAAAPTGLKAVK
jgi:hypothetical protein